MYALHIVNEVPSVPPYQHH